MPNDTTTNHARTYHEDARCGSCGGPLDIQRDAICLTCAPEVRNHAREAAERILGSTAEARPAQYAHVERAEEIIQAAIDAARAEDAAEIERLKQELAIANAYPLSDAERTAADALAKAVRAHRTAVQDANAIVCGAASVDSHIEANRRLVETASDRDAALAAYEAVNKRSDDTTTPV